MVEAAGAELRYLPPYSPDFNPIKNAFSKLKTLLRKAAERVQSPPRPIVESLQDQAALLSDRGSRL
jgi:transposase